MTQGQIEQILHKYREQLDNLSEDFNNLNECLAEIKEELAKLSDDLFRLKMTNLYRIDFDPSIHT